MMLANVSERGVRLQVLMDIPRTSKNLYVILNGPDSCAISGASKWSPIDSEGFVMSESKVPPNAAAEQNRSNDCCTGVQKKEMSGHHQYPDDWFSASTAERYARSPDDGPPNTINELELRRSWLALVGEHFAGGVEGNARMFASIVRTIGEVLDERRRQDAIYGGALRDDENDAYDWSRLISKQVGRIDFSEAEADNPAQHRERFKKIAALAVAAMQSIDRQNAARASD
jgi:hypothetical protein